jgi:hypothetical protein
LTPRRERKCVSTLELPDRLWDPASLLADGYRGLFSQEKIDRSVKLSTYLHLVPTSRVVELYLLSQYVNMV